MKPHTLYQEQLSGNCYKVRLMMAHIGAPYQLADIRIFAGETRTAEYLAINPHGKVPYLVCNDGFHLGESNAILLYLARGSAFLPDEAKHLAKVYEWLFFEQYTHETSIAVRRSFIFYKENHGKASENRLAALLKNGNNALALMERRLSSNDWIAGGDTATVADISLYAYTHMADQGGFDLTAFPKVCEWLGRVSALPGHIDIHYRP